MKRGFLLIDLIEAILGSFAPLPNFQFSTFHFQFLYIPMVQETDNKRWSNVAREKVWSLCDLTPGSSATILSVRCGPELTGQMMGMGLMVGTEVTLLQGGAEKPYLVSVGETRIAMGRELAGLIWVEPNRPSPAEQPSGAEQQFAEKQPSAEKEPRR